MAGNRGIIVKVGERGPAYQMVRITGYKQFPSANIVMWVMNGRALNKHAARGRFGLCRGRSAIRVDPEVVSPPRGSHCSHSLCSTWNIRSRHLWIWKKKKKKKNCDREFGIKKKKKKKTIRFENSLCDGLED